MLEAIVSELPRGAAVQSVTVEAAVPEGVIAPGLAQLQKDHKDVAIGSYPFYREGTDKPFGAQLVVRGRDGAAVERAALALEDMVRGLGAAPQRINPADSAQRK
jgi:molybdopterin-biosynthesis enzyme MoeA-like protein